MIKFQKKNADKNVLKSLQFILDWEFTDSIYYSLISLSTIGFGDYIPSMEPPLRYADYVFNDTACFAALINPIPTGNLGEDGISEECQTVIYINL